jgi:S1-C subfamily serine protease
MRRRMTVTAATFLVLSAVQCARAQDAPSVAIRETVLKSLVFVRASNCQDQSERAGSGFAFQNSGTIVTAHHVVGGCTTIRIVYEGIPATQPRTSTASIRRVLAASDLALLSADTPQSVPMLRLAPPPPDRGKTFAGFGYQNGQPTAGDQLVTFSTGSALLRDILPYEALRELQQSGSAIDANRQVLRFNTALQPGTSGGPIVDPSGAVVGIVAGGLKAGAAPASWGWPSEWITNLMTSSDPLGRPVATTRSYYTLTEMNAEASAVRSGRRLRCGSLEFVFRGTRRYADVARTADDQPRLQYIIATTRRPQTEIDNYKFDIWTHEPSGATAVTPSGYELISNGQVCMARSPSGVFTQVVWGVQIASAADVQPVSLQFEQTVMYPLAPYPFGFQYDQVLSTMTVQFRDNGMTFHRKGFTQPKAQWYPGGPMPPLSHTFETLIAKSGSFLGVGTLNNDLPHTMQFCVQSGGNAPGCDSVIRHLREWTHFVLATQLSTYPST